MAKKNVYYRDWNEIPVVLTLGQCAVVLNISEANARKWAREGILPAVKIGEFWRVEKKELKRLFERMSA